MREFFLVFPRATQSLFILRSIDETVISPIMKKPIDQSAEFDLATELKQKLDILVKKRLAAPAGLGAFNLRTFVPFDPTQPLFILSLCTTGKLPTAEKCASDTSRRGCGARWDGTRKLKDNHRGQRKSSWVRLTGKPNSMLAVSPQRHVRVELGLVRH